MSRRNLVIVVAGVHVSVLVIAVLFGGCAREKKVPKLAVAAPVQEIRAPEAMPESLLEPKGMVEETELLVSREPDSIPPTAEPALASAPKPATEVEAEKKAAVAEEKGARIDRGAAQKEEAIAAAVERKDKEAEAAAERKEMELTAAEERMEKGPVVPAVKRPAAAPAGVREGAGGTHKVAPGESLWRISQRYGVSVAELAEANNLKKDSAIRIGQVLVIPGPAVAGEPKAGEKAPVEQTPAEALRPAAGEKPPSAEAQGAGVLKKHVVQKGETLSSIAKRYRVSLKKLIEVNKIEDPGKIRAGRSLVIPQ